MRSAVNIEGISRMKTSFSSTRSLLITMSVMLFVGVLQGCASQGKSEPPFQGDPWIRAARMADLATMKELMANGKAVDSATADGVTALLVAARMGNVETVKWLLENGANVNHADRDGQTALVYCLTGVARGPKQEKTVELLLKSGGNPFIIDVFGFVPVQEMMMLEMDDLLKTLSYTDKKPCDRVPKIRGEWTLSQAARKNERFEIAEFFEKQGCW
jgi:Ankyrin repeats (3 copies)